MAAQQQQTGLEAEQRGGDRAWCGAAMWAMHTHTGSQHPRGHSIHVLTEHGPHKTSTF